MNLAIPIALVFSIVASTTAAQDGLAPKDSTQQDAEKVHEVVEQVPVWGSCQNLGPKEGEDCTFEKLAQHVGRETNYPKKARRKGIEGMVFVEFVIDREGAVTDASVLRGVHPLLDEEALRVVRTFPDFVPGRQRGKTVKVRYRLPLSFKLE